MEKLKTEDELKLAPLEFQKLNAEIRMKILKIVNKCIPSLKIELHSKSMEAFIKFLESIWSKDEQVTVTTGEAKALLFALMVWVMNCAEGSTEVILKYVYFVFFLNQIGSEKNFYKCLDTRTTMVTWIDPQ